MKIAVVGAGLAGACVVRTLLTHFKFKKSDQIDVYEPKDTLAVGLPYNPADDETVRLNVPPEMMSVIEDKPNDFVEWLEENIEQPKKFEGLVSRPSYGKYLVDRFTPYFEHPQVVHIQNKVADLEVKEKEYGLLYRLKTNQGWSDTLYDAVFFTVGHPPYNDYYNLEGQKNYIHHPYPMVEQLQSINTDSKIGVVGSGATSIDLMRYLHLNHDLKHPLTFYDPDAPFHFVDIPYEGELPLTINEEWIAQEKEAADGSIPLRKIISTFKRDMATAGLNDPKRVYDKYKANTLELKREAFETNDQELALIQTYSAKVIKWLPQLFAALNGTDKVDYLENYHSKLGFFKTRVPNLTYQWLFKLYDAGKLRIVGGLEDITVDKDGRFIVEAEKSDVMDLLINASGFNMEIAKIAETSELIKNLVDKELILPHIDGNFILVDWPETRLINQRYGRMENAFFLGLLIGGAQHENNDAGLTIQQATYTANAFMDNLEK